jgi:hypothetical protein
VQDLHHTLSVVGGMPFFFFFQQVDGLDAILSSLILWNDLDHSDGLLMLLLSTIIS